MTTLVEFLHQRIAEDETIARAIASVSEDHRDFQELWRR